MYREVVTGIESHGYYSDSGALLQSLPFRPSREIRIRAHSVRQQQRNMTKSLRHQANDVWNLQR